MAKKEPTAVEKILAGLTELPAAIAREHGIPSPFAYRGPSAYPAEEVAAGVGRVAQSAGGQIYAQSASPAYVHPPNPVRGIVDRGLGLNGNTFVPPPVVAAASQPVVLPPAGASHKAGVVSVPVPTPTPAPAVSVPEGKAAVLPEQLSGPVARKPIAERFGTLREALRGMENDEYKAFVDNNKHIPGIGYVENKGGRIERIIPSTPSSQEESPDLTPRQLQAMTSLLGVQHQAKTAALAEARLGLEGKRAEREDRRLDLTEKRYDEMSKLDREKFAFEVEKLDKGSSLKEPANYVKALEMFSPDEVDEYGMKTGKKNYQAGGEALSAMGYPVPKGMKIPQAATKIPQKGDVVKGYKFKGGNPADKNSWEKV